MAKYRGSGRDSNLTSGQKALEYATTLPVSLPPIMYKACGGTNTVQDALTQEWATGRWSRDYWNNYPAYPKPPSLPQILF